MLTFWPSSVTSVTPSSAGASTSRTTWSKVRLISALSNRGRSRTLSMCVQSIWMVTHPAYGTCPTPAAQTERARGPRRRVSSRISTIDRQRPAARSSFSAAWCTSWGPSTNVDVRCPLGGEVTVPFWARHPADGDLHVGAFRSFSDFRCPRGPWHLVVAVSDAAGVEDHDVGVVAPEGAARPPQETGNPLGVVLVHQHP